MGEGVEEGAPICSLRINNLIGKCHARLLLTSPRHCIDHSVSYACGRDSQYCQLSLVVDEESSDPRLGLTARTWCDASHRPRCSQMSILSEL
jgi:hypothetical protein